ncbi:hypothetical protein IQ06DRAFT_217567, partial [Phaeosphaeriaceae sp. SRC1lsM3a]
MSTYIGYCISHGLYPDPDDVEVIDLAYSKLPATAMLPRYLVLSTVYFWIPHKLTLESGKLERLHPGFTLDVMTAQAQRTQPPEEGQTDATKTVPQLAKYGLRNSCVFHEHQVIGREQCRSRLTHNKFIFDGLLDACVKEAELLSSVSPYFHATFKGQFKEAADRRISLVDTTAATFRIFLQWAHAQLYSSGRLVDLPDLSILPCTTQPTEEAGASSDGSRIDAHDEDGEDNDYETSSDTSSNASYGHTQEK